VHLFYREKKPVKLATLISVVSTELAESGINFSPSIAGMWRILKGMGFRHSVIKKNPIMYERSDIVKWRHNYLRLNCLFGKIIKCFIRSIEKYREDGFLLVYTDETWVFSGLQLQVKIIENCLLGMTHRYDWLDPLVEDNPMQARKSFRTVGPTPTQSRGKRAIVVGAICQDGIIQESMEIIISGKSTGLIFGGQKAISF
jgi:hypothetical protein